MIIHTASEGISLSTKLESDSAAFYETVAKKCPANAETLLGYAKENRKNIQNTERVYFGVITDAIEGGYAFNLDDAPYAINTIVSESASCSDLVRQALKTEEIIGTFYSEAAAQSKSLLADLPRAFELLARKRRTRLETLKELAAG